MSSSPPETYEVRAGSVDDASIVAAVLTAEEGELRGSSNWTTDAVAPWWSESQDRWIVEDGEPVAYGALLARGAQFDLFVSVHPRARGRGIASMLLDRGEARALELGARSVNTVSFDENEVGGALLLGRGFRPVRRYYRMAIHLPERPDVPALPDGIRAEPFAREHARAFYDALVESFADEWHWRALPYDEWVEKRVDAPRASPDLWTIAWDGSEIAAIVRASVDDDAGWIENIGVRRRWRRRGLAYALLLHAFARFYDRDVRTVRLGVDAENSSGATRLYERAGMEVEIEDVVYEKVLV